MATSSQQARLNQLVELSRELGDPRHDYSILAEGNTSARIDADTFYVKASGMSLSASTAESFVRLRTEAVLGLLDGMADTDEDLQEALLACRADIVALRPSVEATLHALALTVGRARFVGHTHPTPVNAILCSQRADAIAAGSLFPDQVVVCGLHPLFVPYFDPGVPLAREIGNRLREHTARHGVPPKVIYLQNHGLLALGQSAAEVLHVTAMAVKAARILLGSFACGGPRYLGDRDALRIASRSDEHYRQAALGLTSGADSDEIDEP